MRLPKTLLFLLASKALAVPLEAASKPVAKDDILQLPLFGIAAELETVDGKLTKRQVSVDINRQKYSGSGPITALGIPLEVGTPPQTVIVEPDTGSSKFWVPGLRPGQSREEPRSTFFNLEASTSKKDLKHKEVSQYQSEFAVLDVFSDELALRGQSLGASRIGVANLSESQLGRDVGVLGLLTPKHNDMWADDFILNKLVDRNVVQSRAFSAGVRTQGQGSLIFGGYDTAKFSGALEKFDMKPNKYNHYIVEMQSLSFSSGSSNPSQTLLDQSSVKGRLLTIGLDSGSPGLLLSMAAFKAVQTKLGAGVENGVITLPCSIVDSKAALEFKMSSNTTISVLLADLLYARLDNGKRCQLVITYGGYAADMWIGVQYLRRSYVVYDPDNSSVYIARGAACGSNLVPIDNGGISDNVTGSCSPEAPQLDLAAENAPGSQSRPSRGPETQTRTWTTEPQAPTPELQAPTPEPQNPSPDLRPEDIRLLVDTHVDFGRDK